MVMIAMGFLFSVLSNGILDIAEKRGEFYKRLKYYQTLLFKTIIIMKLNNCHFFDIIYLKENIR